MPLNETSFVRYSHAQGFCGRFREVSSVIFRLFGRVAVDETKTL